MSFLARFAAVLTNQQGESAGAISVADQTVINRGDNTYKGKPLFRGAIMDSGSIIPAQQVTTQKPQLVYDTVVQMPAVLVPPTE